MKKITTRVRSSKPAASAAAGAIIGISAAAICPPALLLFPIMGWFMGKSSEEADAATMPDPDLDDETVSKMTGGNGTVTVKQEVPASGILPITISKTTTYFQGEDSLKHLFPNSPLKYRPDIKFPEPIDVEKLIRQYQGWKDEDAD